MSDLQNMEMRALNYYVNKLLCEPETRWVIAYRSHNETYEFNVKNIDALPVINYMQRNKMTNLFNFTLSTEDDPYSCGSCYYVLTLPKVCIGCGNRDAPIINSENTRSCEKCWT